MEPETDSIIRNNANVIDDLPAPVRPTIPIRSRGLIVNDIDLRTKSKPVR